MASTALSESVAQQEYTSAAEQWFEPVFYTTDKQMEHFSIGVFFTLFGLRDEKRDEDRPVRTTLIFIAEDNAIRNGRISKQVIPDFFDEITRTALLNVKSTSDECITLKSYSDDGYQSVYGINTTGNGTADFDRRCLLIALATHQGMDLSALEALTVPEMLNAIILDMYPEK
jgi:hypothetical protein